MAISWLQLDLYCLIANTFYSRYLFIGFNFIQNLRFISVYIRLCILYWMTHVVGWYHGGLWNRIRIDLVLVAVWHFNIVMHQFNSTNIYVHHREMTCSLWMHIFELSATRQVYLPSYHCCSKTLFSKIHGACRQVLMSVPARSASSQINHAKLVGNSRINVFRWA